MDPAAIGTALIGLEAIRRRADDAPPPTDRRRPSSAPASRDRSAGRWPGRCERSRTRSSPGRAEPLTGPDGRSGRDRDDDLAPGVAGLDAAERRDGLAERERAVDHRPQLALVDEVGEDGEVRGVRV